MRLNIISISITIFLLFLGHYNVAQEKSIKTVIDKITEIRNGSKNFTQENSYVSLLNDLANKLRFINPDSLLLVSKEAQLLSNNSNNREEESKALLNIGNYYSDTGKHTDAIEYYRRSLVLATSVENTDLILRIANNLASEHMYNGDYSLALKGYLENIELAQIHGNKTMESILNENIANLYVSQKDYDQAIYFFERVENINKSIGNNITSAQTMSNLAYTYTEMEDFKPALININKSIEIFKNNEEWDWLAYSYMVKGRIYQMQKKHSLALYWYDKSKVLHKDIQDERGIIDLYNGLAEANFALKNDSIALEYALKSFGIASKIKSMDGMKRGSQTLYNIYKKNEEYGTALKYHEIFQKISDTLSRDENRNSLTLLKTEIDFKNQRELLIEENEKALAKQQNYMYISLLVILIMVIVAFIVARAEKIQKKLNQKLKHQKKDLEQRKLQLQVSNETKNKLFSIIAHDLRGPIGALESALQMLNSGDMERSEFMAFVPKLKNDVNNISFTLNNLLSWGQSQMKMSTTTPSNVVLSNLVQHNIELLNEPISSKMINVENLIHYDTCIRADENQLGIVLRNLLSNAIKFTPNYGNITFGAIEKENYVEVYIKDTGQGIAPDIQERILQDNSNYTTYGTNNEKGTGLGLSLCKEMVINNGGTLWVQSEIDKGSTFYFTVPNGKRQCKKTA